MEFMTIFTDGLTEPMPGNEKAHIIVSFSANMDLTEAKIGETIFWLNFAY